MCFHVRVCEKSRRWISIFTFWLNMLLVFLSLALFVAALAVRYRVDRILQVMSGYDPGALCYYLLVLAIAMFLTHVLAAWFCLRAKHPRTRSASHHFFITVIVLVLLLALLIFVGEIVIAAHRGKIYGALEEGIERDMAAYSSDLDSKMRMDYLQLNYQCCGVTSYEDWFTTAWTSVAWVNTEDQEVAKFLVEGEFIKDDAPFSCCSRHSPRACIHHSVQQSSLVTLNTVGCAPAVATVLIDDVITPTACLMLLILITQLVCAVLMRLLQTSIQSIDELGDDPEDRGNAYCFRNCGQEIGKANYDVYKSGLRRKERQRTHVQNYNDDDESLESSDSDDDPPPKKGWMRRTIGSVGNLFKSKKKDDHNYRGLARKRKIMQGRYDDEDGDYKNDEHQHRKQWMKTNTGDRGRQYNTKTTDHEYRGRGKKGNLLRDSKKKAGPGRPPPPPPFKAKTMGNDYRGRTEKGNLLRDNKKKEGPGRPPPFKTKTTGNEYRGRSEKEGKTRYGNSKNSPKLPPKGSPKTGNKVKVKKPVKKTKLKKTKLNKTKFKSPKRFGK